MPVRRYRPPRRWNPRYHWKAPESEKIRKTNTGPAQNRDVVRWRLRIEFCQKNFSDLTEWEQNFMDSIREKLAGKGMLSDRQDDRLREIYHKVGGSPEKSPTDNRLMARMAGFLMDELDSFSLNQNDRNFVASMQRKLKAGGYIDPGSCNTLHKLYQRFKSFPPRETTDSGSDDLMPWEDPIP